MIKRNGFRGCKRHQNAYDDHCAACIAFHLHDKLKDRRLERELKNEFEKEHKKWKYK